MARSIYLFIQLLTLKLPVLFQRLLERPSTLQDAVDDFDNGVLGGPDLLHPVLFPERDGPVLYALEVHHDAERGAEFVVVGVPFSDGRGRVVDLV